MAENIITYQQQNDLSYYPPGFPGSGDLSYRAERCKLDIYYPVNSEKKFPTLIWFHGGGMVGGAKGFNAHISILRERGLAVVMPNYRLASGPARCPDYLEDAAAAVAWVFQNIAQYGGDANSIYLSGGSAGGYLAAMLGLDRRWLARHDLDARNLAGIMPVSGQMATHFQIINERRNTPGGGAYHPLLIDEFAPLFHLSPDAAPIRLYVGDSDLDWPARAEENRLLASSLTRLAGHPDTRCYVLPGYGHGDVYVPALVLLLKHLWEIESRKKTP